MAWQYLKFFHLLSVIIFVSGTFVVTFLMARAAKEKSIDSVVELIKTSARLSMFMIYLPLILAGAFGVLTAWQMKLPLTGLRWLEIAYVATTIGLLTGFFVLGGHGKKALKLAVADLPTGNKSPELQAELDSRTAKIVGGLLNLLVLFILVLMVFKPTW